MQFYSEEECSIALVKAEADINRRAVQSGKYTRGFNDCFAFFALYDSYLRLESRAKDPIVFEWNSTKEFVQKLYLRGHTIESYMEFCGYHIVKNKRPMLGDIAFESGAMIHNGTHWVTTKEDNEGTIYKQAHFLERKIPLIGRPLRS
jgi:hypothetical protein